MTYPKTYIIYHYIPITRFSFKVDFVKPTELGSQASPETRWGVPMM